MSEIRAALDAILPEAVAFRHDLHRHPELGYDEHRTAGKVVEWLAAAGVPHRAGLAGGTGVLGYLPATTGEADARTVALRADMDALPIHEATGLPYASTYENRMHACGHDGHTTILATTARLLAGMERRQNVLFMFQPAEEGGAGGKRMVADGVLRGEAIGRPADVAYGLHGFPGAELGHVTTRVGPLMAAAAAMHIVIRGRGSHAAYPHMGIDPIVVAAHVVTALQTVASRTVGPLDSVVVTIGKLRAGVAHNVIPETAEMYGTLRTLSDETATAARTAIERIVGNVSQAFGATAELTWGGDPYPAVINDPVATERMREVARRVLGEAFVHEEPEPSMGGEDFSFYGREVPACFYFLGLRGVGQPGYPNLHAPTFDFNDEAIPVGVRAMVALAQEG